eukprot:Nitzschia sp. Nitz4//scaffold49_size126201//62701//63798//NITZ4_003644-RA/size126201-processed-gene-0.70-mRNA-1//1//CDS//3329553155//7866//frame0
MIQKHLSNQVVILGTLQFLLAQLLLPGVCGFWGPAMTLSRASSWRDDKETNHIAHVSRSHPSSDVSQVQQPIHEWFGKKPRATQLASSPMDLSATDASISQLPFHPSALSFDHYHGVTLHLEEVTVSPEEFKGQLTEALSHWAAESRKGIWIHVPTDRSDLVPICVDLGFEFHHVQGGNLILTKWLPSHIPSLLPVGPSYQIGVGALVFKPGDQSQLLVVREITGPTASQGVWKIPTGLLDPKEEITTAASRELLEETGLKGHLSSLLCFTQTIVNSDLCFICRMELDDPGALYAPQVEEISEIRWMKVSEYCSQDIFQSSPAFLALNKCILEESERTTPAGLVPEGQFQLGFVEGTNTLYRLLQ